MEEDIKIAEELIKFLSEDITPKFSVEESARAIEHLLQAYKEDESVIHEMAKELNAGVLKKEDWCNLKNCIDDATCLKCLKEYFKNKVKGEKE